MTMYYSQAREQDVGHILIMYRRRGLLFANRVFKRICLVRKLQRWEVVVLADIVRERIEKDSSESKSVLNN